MSRRTKARSSGQAVVEIIPPGKDIVPAPRAGQRARVSRLVTAKACIIELSRIYRDMRRGRLDTGDGYRMAYVIKAAADIHVSAELEQRLVQLERRHGNGEDDA
jgi:hypothetical protein